MTGRRTEVLDAAIEVLGIGGVRRLTYQAVDQAAGVPAGTTSNHFRTRDALMDGVVAHLEALDRRDWEEFGGSPEPQAQQAGQAGQAAQAQQAGQAAQGADALAVALGRFVRNMLGPGRARTAARYALMLEGVARPSVREPLARGRASLNEWGAQWLRELGSPAPLEHCRRLFDFLDGMILHQIAMPDETFEPEPAIRTVLTAYLPGAERP